MATTIVVEEVAIIWIDCPSNIWVNYIGTHCDGQHGEVVRDIAGVYDGNIFYLDDNSKKKLNEFPDHIRNSILFAVEEKLRTLIPESEVYSGG